MNRKAEEAVWEFGPKKLGLALDPPVTDGAVYHWLRGNAGPRFGTAKQIVELLNKGRKKADRLTVEDIMAPHEETFESRQDRRRIPRALPTTTTTRNPNG